MAVFHVTLPYHHSEAELNDAVARQAGKHLPYRILKRSVDARQHHAIKVHYSLTTELDDPIEGLRHEIERRKKLLSSSTEKIKPIIIGSGPGGIFCAYWLRLHGLPPVILEQGPTMRQRMVDMARFMKKGDLDPYSNICFGAGGAGTYSDGKLITRIRSPFIAFVMDTFVAFGAPEEIRYLYNPHLGSNRIRRCIMNMLASMESSGISIHYNTRMTEFRDDARGYVHAIVTHADTVYPVDAVFLACGHSSRETFEMLRKHDVAMSAKEFALGVRVEHPADVINAIQYGARYKERYEDIETAQYKLAVTWKETNRAVYSFCMCPGGYVLNASTESNGVVTNGMSNYDKRGRYSNAAVVVNISHSDLDASGFTGVDASLMMQRSIEAAFRASVNPPGRCDVIPGQPLGDFLEGRFRGSLGPSSCLGKIAAAPLHEMLPGFIHEGLLKGFERFEKKMHGFALHPSAQVFGVESRTSSPYRIERDSMTLKSLTHPNLYPIGEGAGYAGGITSAAVDGIRCAQAYIDSLLSEETAAVEIDEKPWWKEA